MSYRSHYGAMCNSAAVKIQPKFCGTKLSMPCSENADDIIEMTQNNIIKGEGDSSKRLDVSFSALNTTFERSKQDCSRSQCRSLKFPRLNFTQDLIHDRCLSEADSENTKMKDTCASELTTDAETSEFSGGRTIIMKKAISTKALRIPNTCASLKLSSLPSPCSILENPAREIITRLDNCENCLNRKRIPVRKEIAEDEVEKISKSSDDSEPLKKKETSIKNGSMKLSDKIKQSSQIILSSSNSRRDSVVSKIVKDVEIRPKGTSRKTSITAKPIRQRKVSSLNSKLPYSGEQQIQADFVKTLKVTVEIPVYLESEHGRKRFVTDLKSVKNSLLHNSSDIPCISVLDGPSNAVTTTSEKETEPARKNEVKRTKGGQDDKKRDSPAIHGIMSEMTSKPRDYSTQLHGCLHLGEHADDASLDAMMNREESVECILKATQQYPRDQSLLQAACSSLAKFSTLSDTSCRQICQDGWIPHMIGILELIQEWEDVLQQYLTIIERLSEIEELTEELFEHSCHSHVLTTLSRHDDSAEVVSSCLAILSNLITSIEIAKSLMYIGGVHVIIGASKNFPDNHVVQENVCRAIGSFASHDDIGLDVANAGCLQLVVSTLDTLSSTDEKSDHSDDNVKQRETAVECGLYALACLTKYEESARQLSQSNSISDRLIECMERHFQNESCQEYGSWITCNLASYRSSASCVSSVPVLDSLLRALNTYSENINLIQEILTALVNIISFSSTMIEDLVSRGFVPSLLSVIAAFTETAEIQETGCRILGHISVKDDMRDVLEEHESSKTILTAMMSLDNNSSVQEFGAIALMNITANDYENKVRVTRLGGLRTIMSAIRNFLDNSDVVLCSLKLLGNLVEIDEACFRLLDDDGIQIMSRLTKCYKENLEILNFVCDVTVRTSTVSGVGQSFSRQAESVLLEVYSSHDNNEDICASICRFYSNLSIQETSFRSFVYPKGLHTIFNIAERYSGKTEIQLTACKVLASYHMHLKDHDISDQSMDVIMRCLTSFEDNAEIQTACLGAVTYMTECSDYNREKLLVENILSSILSVLTRHAEVVRLHVVGLMATDNLLSKAKMADIGNMKRFTSVVLDSLTKSTDNNDIQLYCCKIISRLQTIDCRNTSTLKDCFLVPLVDVLRRRRSTEEVKSAARTALKQIVNDAAAYQNLLNAHDLNSDFDGPQNPHRQHPGHQ